MNKLDMSLWVYEISFPTGLLYFKLPSHNSLNKQAKTELIHYAIDQTKGSKWKPILSNL